MSLVNPADSIERQNEKLMQIATSLMRRVEQKNDEAGAAYAQFERAALLEVQVRERTCDLERTLDLLQESNARLETASLETREARATLTEAIETISEGFALFDPEDRLILFNSRFCRGLSDVVDGLRPGLTFAQYVGLISTSRHLSLPDTLTPRNWADKRTRRHRDERVVFNVSLTRDRWLQVSEHRTAQGGTVILQTDVTNIIRLERQEREKMRDAQAQILQATLDHLDQGVCIFDRDQRLVGWNKRMDYLLDLPPQQAAMGHGFSGLLKRLNDQLRFSDPFDADMLETWVSNTQSRPPIAFEVVRETGQTFSVFAQEMPDRGFVISFTDVTAERAAGRALAEMNEMLEQRVEARTQALNVALAEAERANASKSRFVAAASHDLLQPLSAAKLFMSSLTGQLPDAATRDVVHKAESALSSVERIIEALLDISRLDARRPTFDVQPVRLSAILDPLADELTPVAQAKGVSLRVVPCGLSVRSDPGYLRRIVQNLVSNAIRYTDSGRVVVGVRRRAGVARLEVWDTGRGVAKADQKAIFQEFKRLDTSQPENSLGLGLAIVERACKSLGHPLELSSEPGRGSVFSVELPVRKAGMSTVESPPDAPLKGLVEKGQIVFLVENDDSLARAMTLMIEGWGAQVIHAASGEEGLALLSDIDLRPDALMLDHQLGDGMTGIELLRRIRLRYGHVPARLISADRSAELRAAARDAGAVLLGKPVDEAALVSFLNEAARVSAD
ncbi:PAS-domain containing protein [Sulfitobacter albidus]|uniref:histidine kinase n=1 Tax=Sulfitobacter albidus TaxID=2829501 RepID=A0A975JEG2_9RHOB|nr:PAS-domain containing protein [Sulfitobacter albidus]QUJ76765.1 PAS-domain containing protein [Sulfitobacter albidus]